uniref:Uncharacterized protein n=1 Tax=viral metagenome TaxID=1070528 RepID=A0A6C0D0Z2_9ZZZZ
MNIFIGKIEVFKYNYNHMTMRSLEFVQVNFYQLKPNKKYIITDLNGAFYYTGTFSNYHRSGKDVANFKDVTCNVPIKRQCGYITFSYDIGRKYYTIRSKKKEIQNEMERRALAKILISIIGDESFIW